MMSRDEGKWFLELVKVNVTQLVEKIEITNTQWTEKYSIQMYLIVSYDACTVHIHTYIETHTRNERTYRPYSIS
jgi:hypothetical protein